jgi:hypothetical protein
VVPLDEGPEGRVITFPAPADQLLVGDMSPSVVTTHR